MEFISLGKTAKSISGRRFNRLIALGPVSRKYFPSGSSRISWLCRCDCGTEKVIEGQSLVSGNTGSCGCALIDSSREQGLRRRRHGQSRHAQVTAEYMTWSTMRKRCNNPNCKKYEIYGGRGIKVCERWDLFENFMEDMGPRPSPKHSINRIDNDGNYEPSNCHWATRKEQAENRRSNVVVKYAGREGPLSTFFEGGIDNPDYALVLQRIYRGWDIYRAFTESR
jgi:hypothetical protein